MIKLLTAAIATNGVPSGATAGFSLKKGEIPGRPNEGFLVSGKTEMILKAASTAGSGTMTCTLRLWGYDSLSAVWYPLGVNATMATRGVLNDGNALGEDGADTLRHVEVVESLRHFQRVYLEIVAIGGTDTAISAWLSAVN